MNGVDWVLTSRTYMAGIGGSAAGIGAGRQGRGRAGDERILRQRLVGGRRRGGIALALIKRIGACHSSRVSLSLQLALYEHQLHRVNTKPGSTDNDGQRKRHDHKRVAALITQEMT